MVNKKMKSNSERNSSVTATQEQHYMTKAEAESGV